MAIKPLIIINRELQDENQTLGICSVFDDCNRPLFCAVSLERGWQNNKKNISCIPDGTYDVVLEYSNKFEKHLWEIKDVKNRSECKFHSANYWYQLNGCIALGNRTKDINSDGYNDVLSSRRTMEAFHEALKGHKSAILIITGNK